VVCLMIMRKAKRGAQSSIISYIILFGLLALTFLYIFSFRNYCRYEVQGILINYGFNPLLPSLLIF